MITARGQLKAKPFIKWAGGKGQLLPQIHTFLPESFNNYYEPFVGGGALFFSLDHTGKSYLNDINKYLIHTYKTLQNESDALIAELKKIEEEYKLLEDEVRQVFFYEKRALFNKLSVGFEKSVLLLFLNRTCFNGLYRENRSGEFNVPFGRHKNPSICNEDNINAINTRLQLAKITNTDYKSAVRTAKAGDFIYFDPPYQPLNETSSFTAYNQDGFTTSDQKELGDLFKDLDKRGCYVMLSNSSAELIKELYKDFNQHTVLASRNINAKGSSRGKIPELLVTNY